MANGLTKGGCSDKFVFQMVALVSPCLFSHVSKVGTEALITKKAKRMVSPLPPEHVHGQIGVVIWTVVLPALRALYRARVDPRGVDVRGGHGLDGWPLHRRFVDQE